MAQVDRQGVYRMNSVTRTTRTPQPKLITRLAPFLMGLEHGQSLESLVYDGYSFFAGEGLRQYELGFLLGRQAQQKVN